MQNHDWFRVEFRRPDWLPSYRARFEPQSGQRQHLCPVHKSHFRRDEFNSTI